MKVFLLLMCLFVLTNVGKSSSLIPPNFNSRVEQYIPILRQFSYEYWPNLKLKSTLSGQIEQETCYSLTHSKCWNPRAELNTSIEYGFGLGQITISYNKNGIERFNNFNEIKKLNKLYLDSWKWEDRYSANYQIMALVIYDKNIYSRIKFTDIEYNRLAFMLSAYNGGLGGVLQDRKLCLSSIDDQELCNQWFGGVEDYSWKAKIKVGGYGKSFFEINREYVSNILLKRRFKYVEYMETN